MITTGVSVSVKRTSFVGSFSCNLFRIPFHLRGYPEPVDSPGHSFHYLFQPFTASLALK